MGARTGTQQVIVKDYRGASPGRITRKFQRDAQVMARQGYVPINQTWVNRGCLEGLFTFLLSAGTLSGQSLQVTYQRQGR